MATLEKRIKSLAEHTATVIKNLKVKQGNLANLTTNEKDSLVGALNELKGLIANAGASIDDTQASADTVYSATKVEALINTAITDLVNGAGSDSDTLKELADKIGALAQADNGLVSALASQSFSSQQQAQARTNIDAVSTAQLSAVDTKATEAKTTADTLTTNIGNTDRDFVADFNTIYNA